MFQPLKYTTDTWSSPWSLLSHSWAWRTNGELGEAGTGVRSTAVLIYLHIRYISVIYICDIFLKHQFVLNTLMWLCKNRQIFWKLLEKFQVRVVESMLQLAVWQKWRKEYLLKRSKSTGNDIFHKYSHFPTWHIHMYCLRPTPLKESILMEFGSNILRDFFSP